MGIPATLSSVPAQTPYIQYVATSGQTVFPYPFEITQDSDLVAVANGTTLATDSGYTLSGVGNATGGNLTFTSGRTVGDIITLYRDIPIERLTQFAQNGGFSSTAFNAEFNNVYLLLQQLQQNIDQCLQIPNTNNPAPTVSLTPGSYANKYLAFDGNGNPEPAELTSSGTVTGSLIAGLLDSYTSAPVLASYSQTAAESNANVTPVNYSYPPYHAFRYLTAAQVTAVQANNTSINDAAQTALTAALQNWLTASAGQYAIWPAGSYVINSQLTAGSGTKIVGDARGKVLVYYLGSSAITGGSMLLFSAGSSSICSAFALRNVQFICTNVVTGNTTAQLELLNPLYFEVKDCVFGASGATNNALVGIYIHQNGSSFVPPLGNGRLTNIQAVVEPPGVAVAGSCAVKIVGNSGEQMQNIILDGQGAIEHFNVGVLLENANGCQIGCWEFRGSSGDSGDTCISLVNASGNALVNPTLAPAASVGTGISFDSNSSYNVLISPNWNLSSGNPSAAYTDSGQFNSVVQPGNAGTFTPVAKLAGPLLLQKFDGFGPNLAVQRNTSDTGEAGVAIYADHTPTNQAYLLVDRGSGVSTQDLSWIGANGSVFDRVDDLGQRYLKAPNAAPSSSNLANSQFTVWLDEVGNNIKFECKLSNGTVKTGTLAIS